jgi:hypothetical protein
MKSRYLVIFSILAVIFGFIQLRFNYRSAVSLRDSIVQKDLAASPVSADIKQLTDFVHTHMRADVDFELAGSYERALAAAQPAVSGEVYAQAQAACAGRNDSITQARCVTDFVSRRLPAAPPAQPMPDRAKFTYAIHSPLWAADLAGLSFLMSVVSMVSAGAIKLIRPAKGG